MQNSYRLFPKDIPSFNSLPSMSSHYPTCKNLLFVGQSDLKSLFCHALNSTQCHSNIYLSMKHDSYKLEDIADTVKEYCTQSKYADDLCYIYNFKDKMSPRCIAIPHGTADMFKKDIQMLVKKLHSEVVTCITSEVYNSAVENIKKEYYVKKKEYMAALSDSDQDLLNLKLINEINTTNNLITDFEISTMSNIVEAIFSELEMKPYMCNHIDEFISSLKKEILSSMITILETESDTVTLLSKFNSLFISHLYNVANVSVVSPSDPVPTISGVSLSISDLVGKICIYSEHSGANSDYIKIIPGLLHMARGGYLILNSKELVMNYHLCDIIINALMSEEINIQKSDELCGYIPQCYASPEPAPLQTKLIIVGSQYSYDMLCKFNSHFITLFPQMLNVDDEVERNSQNIQSYMSYFDYFSNQQNDVPISMEGKYQLLRHLSMHSESGLLLSNHVTMIDSIINMAYTHREKPSPKISGNDILTGIRAYSNRIMLIQDKMSRNFSDGKITIDTKSKSVGQINCLTLMSSGDFFFGMPCRITASTYAGTDGISCVDKDNQFSGKIFNKSINIMNGYIGEKYGQDSPLYLNAHICFEQNYSYIDGDSATCACMVALVSSLSELPIIQGIAITGSMDQKGNVQAVGGVNHKIESFYDICKTNTLDGYQGVIIPKSNVKDLILRNDILQSIKDGYFSIYAIQTIQEAFHIMLGCSTAIVQTAVQDKLKKYSTHYLAKS